MNANRIQFGLGLLIVLVTAALLLTDVIESGFAAGLGIIGIGLIGSSRTRSNQD